MSNELKYKMTLSLSVLNHLGVNLYSNIPAVMSEVVANAWDADAEEVTIDIDLESGKIVVVDNGCGMSTDDINNKFLLVGYNRRNGSEAQTAKGRIPMGRKGIGKLSLFSIADKIEVHSKKGEETNAFLLDSKEIKTELDSSGSEYHPKKIEYAFPDLSGESGTRLVIRELKKTVNASTASFLRRRLARRFAFYGAGNMAGFKVSIDNEPITISDRDFFHKLEYLFQFDKDYGQHCPNLEDGGIELRGFRFNESGRSDQAGGYTVHGWLGLARSSKDLIHDGDNINKVTIFARNKLAQEDILDEYGFQSMFTRFVIGEIYADFLDDDREEDIATSSRQKIFEDDPRYVALKKFLKTELEHVRDQRDRFKAETGEKSASALIPKIREWLDRFDKPVRKQASAFLGRVNKASANDEDRKRMFALSVHAFESYRARNSLEILDSVTLENMGEFLDKTKQVDDLEMAHYYNIARNRMSIIEKLDSNFQKNVYEAEMRDFLAKHLWLLDPSWDRATEHPEVEERLRVRIGRKDVHIMDIKYRRAPGVHVIVELKRPDVRITQGNLTDQVVRYQKALRECLREIGKYNEPIEAVCVLGSLPINWEERAGVALEKQQIRVLTYQQLVAEAHKSYQEYLEVSRECGEINKIIREIDDCVD